MFDGPMPALDLSRMRRLDGDVPRAVLEVLVEGLEQVEDLKNGYLSRVFDDDAEGTSTYAYGVDWAQRTLPVRKARDAWRLAAERGIVPAGWIEDPRRCFPDQELLFFCKECGGMGATGYNYDDICGVCDGRGNAMRRGSVAWPTSIAEVQWMLAHPGLVEQAEGLAREAVRRLGGAGRAPADGRVQWGRVRQGKPLGTVPVIIASPIWDLTRSRRATWDWKRMKGPAFIGAPWWPEARRLNELTREILCFDVGMAWADQAAGVEESPFEPLLRLWELGVMIEELTAEAIVLERAGHRYIRSWRAGVPYG
jgi:hypothetical protein